MSRKTQADDDFQLQWLCNAEQEMKNEVVVLNFESTPFCKVFRAVAGMPLTYAAVLKAFQMLQNYYEKNGCESGVKMCTAEIEHLNMAASREFLQNQYPLTDFSACKGCRRDAGETEKYHNRLLLLFWLLDTLAAAALLAVIVLALHGNFWFFWMLCMLMMFLAYWWTYRYLVPHLVFNHLCKTLKKLDDGNILEIHRNFSGGLQRKNTELNPQKTNSSRKKHK